MINDPPIHLPTRVVKAEVELFQDHLDGLCALMHFCEGVSRNGNGQVPGHFELVMHYRALKAATRPHTAAGSQE